MREGNCEEKCSEKIHAYPSTYLRFNSIAIPLGLSPPGALVLGSDYRREYMNNSRPLTVVFTLAISRYSSNSIFNAGMFIT